MKATPARVAPETAGEPEAGLPAAATGAMARVAAAEAPDLQSSWSLTGPMIVIAINVLVWSLPSPSAGTLGLVVLCLALALLEHHRARARFRREVAGAGEQHGARAMDAARAAQAMAKALLPEGRSATRELDR